MDDYHLGRNCSRIYAVYQKFWQNRILVNISQPPPPPPSGRLPQWGFLDLPLNFPQKGHISHCFRIDNFSNDPLFPLPYFYYSTQLTHNAFVTKIKPINTFHFLIRVRDMKLKFLFINVNVIFNTFSRI